MLRFFSTRSIQLPVFFYDRQGTCYLINCFLSSCRLRPLQLSYLPAMAQLIRKEDALEYHQKGRPGKIEVIPTKETKTQRDLALAYSPGVAEPCLRIHDNPDDVYRYTAKGNLVAVISNGTAVLGLGNIGPEASTPVTEGKG